MGAELPYQICEIGAIYRMWCDTQNTHLPCQSTPSLWKVTAGEKMVTAKFQISIHTFWQKYTKQSEAKLNFNPHLPCGRWRDKILKCFVAHQYFNPHLPCGRWQSVTLFIEPTAWFQSTPSLRKVTRQDWRWGCEYTYFNPHLPCGRWQKQRRYFMELNNFNPHLPCGRWLRRLQREDRNLRISIHTFLAEGDVTIPCDSSNLIISIHTFLAEGDSKNIYNYFFVMHIFMHYILSYL